MTRKMLTSHLKADPFVFFDNPENCGSDELRKLTDLAENLAIGYLLNSGGLLFLGRYERLQEHHFLNKGNWLILEKLKELAARYNLTADNYWDGATATIWKDLLSELKLQLPELTMQWIFNTSLQAKNLLQYDCWIDEIISNYKKRKISEISDEAREMIKAGHKPDDVAAKVRVILEEEEVVEKDIFTASELIQKIHDNAKNKKQVFETGLQCLDASMGGGLHAGKMYVIAARPSHGKTLFAATLAENLSKNSVPTFFAAYEMGASEIFTRILARMGNCFPSDVKNTMQAWVWERITAYLARNPSLIKWFEAKPYITKIDELCNEIRKQHKKDGIRGVFIDYLSLVGGKDSRESETEHQGRVAQAIASLCVELEIWAVVLAQTNRTGEDLLGSDGALRAADQVYILEKLDIKDIKGRETAWLKLKKTRYTIAQDVGTKESPLLYINSPAPYFAELEECQ